MSNFSKVFHFMHSFGQETLSRPTLPDVDLAELRLNLIQEELDELGTDVKSMSKLSNDAFLHALQDKIDKYYQTALTEREKEIEAFEEHCKSSQEECYPCATQRHACEHDNWEEYFYRTERDWSDDSIPNDWEIEGATSEK